MDIDLAVQVPDWTDFERIRDSLVREGYTKTDLPHRLLGPSGAPIDILPFGAVESDDSTMKVLRRLLNEDLVANLTRDSGNACGEATEEIVSAFIGGLFGSEATNVQN